MSKFYETDFASVWESVDKLKAGLARTERKLVQAGQQDWKNDIHHLNYNGNEELLKPDSNAKPVRKIRRIGNKRVEENAWETFEDLDEEKGTDPIKKRKRLPSEKPDWNNIFRKNIFEESEDKMGDANDMEASSSKVKYLNEDIPPSVRVLHRPKTAPEVSRLSAGYDPSEQKNKLLDRNDQNYKDFKLQKSSIKMSQNVDSIKNSPRKRNSIKEQKISSWNESKRADGLQKLGELVEKQQLKLVKRSKSASDTRISSKPSKPIIPIAISSQNTVTSSQQVDAPPNRKIAPAPPVTSYPGFSDPRRLETRNSSFNKGKKAKVAVIQNSSEKKVGGSNKKSVTKKVAKISGNIEDYIICPSSWRKGQELIKKELPPEKFDDLKKVDRNKEKIGVGRMKERLAEESTVANDRKRKSEPKPSQSNRASSSLQRELSKSEELPSSKDNYNDNTDRSLTESISETHSSSKSLGSKNKVPIDFPPTKKPKPKQTKGVDSQPVPKVRHYNPDVVRNYMQKQKKERLQHMMSEKQKKQQEKEEREQKLRELQQLQKKLAKAAIPKRSDSKKDIRDSDMDKDEFSEQHSSVSTQDTDFEEQDKDDDPVITPVETNLPSPSESSVASHVSCSQPAKQEIKPSQINAEEIYKKIQDFDDILASISSIQEPLSKSSNGKIERIHATALSIQQQLDNETDRIQQILCQNNNNDDVVDSFYPQPFTMNGVDEETLSPMPSHGQGEASKHMRESSPAPSSSFQTRHERIVRSKSQFSVFDGNLPGVTNLIRHAQSVSTYQMREAAAKRIQAAFRGFKVRKALKWRLLKENKVNLQIRRWSLKERSNSEAGDSSSLSGGPLDDTDELGKNLLPEQISHDSGDRFELKYLSTYSKPDPYNFINTLHRTLQPRTYNVSPVSTPVHFMKDVEENLSQASLKKSEEIKSTYSEDFEPNSVLSQGPRTRPMGAESDELSSKSSQVVDESKSKHDTEDLASEKSHLTEENPEETLSEGSLTFDSEASPLLISPVPNRPHTYISSVENNTRATTSKSDVEKFREATTSSYKSQELKFSPNSLKLKMSNELMYLESLDESLRHIDQVERIQGVGLAQQETVTLAQALQNERQKRLDEIEKFKTAIQQEASDRERQILTTQKNQQEALTAVMESVKAVRSETATAVNTTTQKVLQSQADAAKITAEAAKQLAQANIGLTQDLGEITKGTATSAAIAAVTSVLKHLHRNPSRRSFGSDSENSASFQRSDSRARTRHESSSDESYNNEHRSKNASRLSLIEQSITSNVKTSEIREEIPSSHRSLPEEVTTLISKPESASVTLSGGSVISEDLNEDKSMVYSTQFEDTNSEHEGERSSRRTSFEKRIERKTSKEENIRGSLLASAEKLSGSDGIENMSEKTSFNNFTLEMVKQYMKKEEMRAKHEMALLKLREKSLIEKTKAEVAWLELQKQQLRDKGLDDKMPPLRKRQRWLMLRLQQEQAEIMRLREAQLVASQERQMLLEQQQQIAHLRQSTRHILGKIREISPGMQIPSLKSLPSTSRSLDVSPKSSLRMQVLSSSDTVPTDEEFMNVRVTDTQSDVGEIMSDNMQTPASRDSKSDSELQIEQPDGSYKTSTLANRVLQGLNKLERNKRMLTLREQKLLQRRKDVENLLAWRDKLQVEEDKVKAMEEKALRRGGEVNGDPHSKAESNKLTSNVSTGYQANTLNDIPEEIDSVNKTSREQSSIHGESKLEEGSLDSSVSEEISSPGGVIAEQVKTKSGTGGEDAKIDSSVDYGNSFESSTSQQKSVSFEKQVPAANLSLRLPLSPRTRSKRRDSSGSEDSFTVSQSETASDVSDIEGRVHALKEELRRRKTELDRLKKEQKRRNKERLKAQEASLLKQIEACNRFISKAKSELDHELEVETRTKVTVKPQIRQPKVAESKHVAKLSASHGWAEGAGDEGANSQSQHSPKTTSRDDTIASSLSDLTMSDSIKTSPVEGEKSLVPEESAKKEEDGDTKATESEESTSDSVKTVTEKTEDLILQSDRNLNKTSEKEIPEPTPDISNKVEVLEKSKESKSSEKIPSDDETVAEEIVDEIVEGFDDGLVVNDKTRVPQQEKSGDEISENSSTGPEDVEKPTGHQLESDQVIEAAPTSPATSSSTFQDEKKEESRDAQIEKLISNLVQEELNSAIREIEEKLKKKRKVEEQINICDTLVENMMEDLYEVNTNIMINLYQKKTKVASPVNVGQRVRSIMNELEQKSTTSSPQERPSLSDILSISSPSAYNDVLTSPEGSPSLSESPARADGMESPLSRPLSPILGFSNEQYQGHSDNLLDHADLSTDQDWFEDEIGGSSNFYQIYPYKQSYYIREIPNKPPPPYTPPNQSAVSLMPSNISLRSNAEDVHQFIASHTEGEIQTLVARATTLVQNGLTVGTPIIAPPDDYFYIPAIDDESRISDRDQSAFRLFIFDLTKEIVSEIHETAHEPPRPPWMKPKWLSHKKSGPKNRSSAELISYVQKQVLAVIRSNTGYPGSSSSLRKKGSSVTMISGKKQDRVDEILVKELREEELEWVSYDEDEVNVKIQVADSILNCLIKETAQVFSSIYNGRQLLTS